MAQDFSLIRAQLAALYALLVSGGREQGEIAPPSSACGPGWRIAVNDDGSVQVDARVTDSHAAVERAMEGAGQLLDAVLSSAPWMEIGGSRVEAVTSTELVGTGWSGRVLVRLRPSADTGPSDSYPHDIDEWIDVILRSWEAGAPVSRQRLAQVRAVVGAGSLEAPASVVRRAYASRAQRRGGDSIEALPISPVMHATQALGDATPEQVAWLVALLELRRRGLRISGAEVERVRKMLRLPADADTMAVARRLHIQGHAFSN